MDAGASIFSGGGASSATGSRAATPAAPSAASVHYPNPNVQNNPHVYMAVYSSIPVYEMMVRGVGVMRRRSDSYMNATHILKVAGVDKGKRTKILDKEIIQGDHEKVQGGYGKYQGTWIPFWRAQDLAAQFGVTQLLSPLFDYAPGPPTASNPLNGSDAASLALGPHPSNTSAPLPGPTPLARSNGSASAPSEKREREEDFASQAKRTRMDLEGPESLGRLANGIAANGCTPGANNAAASTSYERHLRRSTKVSLSQLTADLDRLARHQQTAIKTFNSERDRPPNGSGESGTDHEHDPVPDLAAVFDAADLDLPIDDFGHTTLHWAAALGRPAFAAELIRLGGDPTRGNAQGETPLIRSVLVTNSHDSGCFPSMLDVLGSTTLRLVDDANRTLLHHIALVASVKGRGASARYYMECVLEYVARKQGGDFQELVDAVDVNGDTALNVSARVGNRSLVSMLVECGADKSKANKLGLRPVDFGVEGEALTTTAGEDAIATIRHNPSVSGPARKSRDVINSMTTLIDSLATDFATEVKSKTEALERTRAQLRASTRELAERRRQIAHWRSQVSESEQVGQRIKNLERALVEEDTFDWTGRTEVSGAPARPAGGSAFAYRGPGSTLAGLPAGQIQLNLDADPPVPSVDTPASLVHLRRMEAWYGRVLGLLQARTERIQGASVEQERRCRRIVSVCCGVELDKVDGMLESLVMAMESDGPNLDLIRVAGFMNRVNAGTFG